MIEKRREDKRGNEKVSFMIAYRCVISRCVMEAKVLRG